MHVQILSHNIITILNRYCDEPNLCTDDLEFIDVEDLLKMPLKSCQTPVVLDMLNDAGMDAMQCELYFHRGRDLMCGEVPCSDQKDMATYNIISNESSISYLSGKKASVVCSNILRALKYGDEH